MPNTSVHRKHIVSVIELIEQWPEKLISAIKDSSALIGTRGMLHQ